MTPLQSLLERHQASPPNILAALQAIQEAYGWVDPAHVPAVAKALGVTDSDVRGVLSFYRDLRTRPPGRHVVRVCTGDSCVAARGAKVLAALERKLGVEAGETTRNGKVTLEKVCCLGNCALSPSAMVDGEVRGRLAPKDAAGILKGMK